MTARLKDSGGKLLKNPALGMNKLCETLAELRTAVETPYLSQGERKS